MANKVLVIGLDGATWKVMDPLLKKGVMPFLAKLVGEGASGVLHSTNPPMTPVAWTCFQTGVYPQKNGIIHYHLFSPSQKETQVIDSTQIEIPTIHDLISLHKKKIITVNLPVTYPVKKTNGIMISGILTPDSSAEYTYPSYIKEEIEQIFGPFPFSLGSENFKKDKSLSGLVTNVTTIMEQRCNIAQYLMEKKEWDLFLYHFKTLDALQHPAYTQLQPGLTSFSESNYAKILPYFKRMDALIERFVSTSEAQQVIIMSDHGFCEQKSSFAFNLWLQHEGYLQMHDTSGKKVLRKATQKVGHLLDKIGMSKKVGSLQSVKNIAKQGHIDIDWNTTQVYMGSGLYVGYLYIFNKEVLPILKEKILSLTDENGTPFIENVFTREEFFNKGYHGDFAPDLIVVPKKGYVLSPRLEGKLSIVPTFGKDYNVGVHDSEGIIVLHGKDIQSTTISAHIVDILPTIHHFLGLPQYPHFEGSIIKDY